MRTLRSKKGLYLILFFITLSLFDLLFPSKGNDVNRIVPQLGRAVFFCLMLITIFRVKIADYKIPKPITAKGVNYLLFVFLVMSLFHLELVFNNILSMVKILYWITGYYFFYYAIAKGLITFKHLEYFAIAGVIIYFLVILRDYTNRSLWEGSKEFFVSNNSYHLLKLVPLILLLKNRYTNILILLIAMGMVLAFKRGALLAFSITFVMYYFYILFKVKEKKFLKLVLGVGVVLTGIYFFNQNIDVFLSRNEDLKNLETAGSGRGNMFSLILDDMINVNSDPFTLFFGNGIYATKDFFQRTIGHRIVAHSDLLEFFYDFGIIGLLCFMFFFYRIIKLFVFFKNEYYGFILVIWLTALGLSSLYSINLFTAEMIYAILPIVLLENERIMRIKKKKKFHQFE